MSDLSKMRAGAPRINDPVFGSLLFMEKFWAGAGQFPPTGDRIEWFIDGDETGPQDSQRILFGKIVERYSTLLPELHAVLAKHATPEPSQAVDLSIAIRLAAVSIASRESPDMEWEISFDSLLRDTVFFVVEMKGWSPTGVDVCM